MKINILNIMPDSDSDFHDGEMGKCVSFDDPSPSFVHGFEAGQLWGAMERQESAINPPWFHGENIELAQRMASQMGYKLEIKPMSHGYFSLSASLA